MMTQYLVRLTGDEREFLLTTMDRVFVSDNIRVSVDLEGKEIGAEANIIMSQVLKDKIEHAEVRVK